SDMINQKENRLIRGNSKIRADQINYQGLANAIDVTYKVNEELILNTLITSGVGIKPDFNVVPENIGLISNSKIMGIDASYLANTANVEVSAKTFMRDEIYS